jgi:hypothetical protein
MPTVYKTDLIPPDAVAAYKAANPIGRQIVLPDLKNPGKSIAYTIQEIRIEDARDHPETGDPFKLVTQVLKN